MQCSYVFFCGIDPILSSLVPYNHSKLIDFRVCLFGQNDLILKCSRPWECILIGVAQVCLVSGLCGMKDLLFMQVETSTYMCIRFDDGESNIWI